MPAPDAFLHHIVGAPDVLDYTKDINAYMRVLASKSPRVKVRSIGMSGEGREMLVVAVSDEANLGKLDRYKEITARLADPRGLSEADAQKLIAEGKPIYWADGSIHSPKSASAGDADGAGVSSGGRSDAVHTEDPQRPDLVLPLRHFVRYVLLDAHGHGLKFQLATPIGVCVLATSIFFGQAQTVQIAAPTFSALLMSLEKKAEHPPSMQPSQP